MTSIAERPRNHHFVSFCKVTIQPPLTPPSPRKQTTTSWTGEYRNWICSAMLLSDSEMTTRSISFPLLLQTATCKLHSLTTKQ